MALERYVTVTPRNGKYSPDTLRMKEDFEREFLALGPGPRSGGCGDRGTEQTNGVQRGAVFLGSPR
jgi:hypothetical protein